MSNRITLGFHRIGIVVAVIVFIAMIISAASFGGNGVQGLSLDALLECLLTAVIIYCVFRLLGWAINGFAGKSNPPDN